MWYPKGRKTTKRYKRAKTADDRFFEKIEFIPFHACWEWIGVRNNWGYGYFYENQEKITAHRWSYQRFNGPIPASMVIMHTCDNPGCVRPEHLRLGTKKDNSQDSVKKGRAPKGTKRVSADVRKIIVKAFLAGIPTTKIAEMCEVTPGTVRHHVEGLVTRKDSDV
jgi:hypothetical protein